MPTPSFGHGSLRRRRRKWAHSPVAPARLGGGERGGGAFLPDLFGGAGRQWVWAAFGADLAADPDTWSWTDITHYFLWDAEIVCEIGAKNESLRLVPASLSGTLKNNQPNGGDWTLDNALSPLQPYVRENLPIRARLDVGNGASDRFFGYLTTAKPTRNAGGAYNLVSLVAHGVSRRLRQGEDAKFSPMYRWHMLSHKFPVDTNAGWPNGDQQYHALPTYLWPLEESAGALRGANVIDPAYPLVADGVDRVPQFGGDSYLNGVRSLTTFNYGSGLSVVFPRITPGGRIETDDNTSLKSIRTQFLVRVDQSTQDSLIDRLGNTADAIKSRVLTMRVDLTGAETVVVYFDSDGTYLLMYLDTLDSNGVSIDTKAGGETGLQWELGVYVTIDLVQNGTAVETRMSHLPLAVNLHDAIPEIDFLLPYYSQFIVNRTLGGITGYTLAEGAIYSSGGIGMLSVHNGASDTFPTRYPPALLGSPGETVAQRLYRLGVEESVSINVIGDATDIPMGPQSVDGFLNLIYEAVDVDLGRLLDGLDPGLTYIARQQIYSQTPSLTLDAADGDTLGPDDPDHDDQGRINTYTARSRTGSSQTFTQSDGPLGTDTVGTYATGGDHRAALDGDLYQIAAWKVGQGSVRGLRYPRVRFQLAKPATSVKAQQWLDTRPTNRLVVAGGQPAAPDPDLSLVLLGWTERWNSKTWSVVANTGRYAGYGVTTLAQDSGDTSAFLGWLDVDTVTTAATLDAGGTSVTVNVTGQLLTNATTPSPNYADDIDGLYINLDGMKVGVTAITGAASPQTLTLVGADVLRAVPPGSSVSAWDPVVIGL